MVRVSVVVIPRCPLRRRHLEQGTATSIPLDDQVAVELAAFGGAVQSGPVLAALLREEVRQRHDRLVVKRRRAASGMGVSAPGMGISARGKGASACGKWEPARGNWTSPFRVGTSPFKMGDSPFRVRASPLGVRASAYGVLALTARKGTAAKGRSPSIQGAASARFNLGETLQIE